MKLSVRQNRQAVKTQTYYQFRTVVKLQINTETGGNYKSKSQIARVCTESWASLNLYCPACPSDFVKQSKPNRQAIDFECENCNSLFQLKATTKLGNRILDGSYDAMRRQIETDETPNLVLLHYDQDWRVKNLLLIPSFFFSVSCLIKRNPLSPNARRAGYIGCVINLKEIADIGKIWIVRDSIAITANVARDSYSRVQPISKISADTRGWTLEVLNLLQSMNENEFSLKEAYSFEPHLQEKYPKNQHIRDKIRQQLQVLRDLGLLDFLGKGRYRWKQ